MTDSSTPACLRAAPSVLPLGDAAWTVVFGEDITAHNSALALGFCASLGQQAGLGPFKGIREWAPAFASVTVYIDPAQVDQDAFAQALQQLAEQVSALGMHGRQWRIPVCFDPDYAPDLHSLAQACGLSPDDVVQRMTQSVFTVRMLGFLPGFPYMDGLPPELSLPRLKQPRQAVPARSIAVAGQMCAAYPWVSPGGWHLLGRTPAPLFELGWGANPALLAPGDRVQWQAVPIDTYLDMERDFARADWNPETLRLDADESAQSQPLRFRPGAGVPDANHDDAVDPSRSDDTRVSDNAPASHDAGASDTTRASACADTGLVATGRLEVIEPAWAVTVQDDGRQGSRYLGVPLSGAADTRSLAAANILLDNEPWAAALELPGAGPTLRVTAGPIRCALAGDGYLLRTDNRNRVERLPAWRGVTAQTGDTIQACLTSGKLGYLAFSGGLHIPEVLGSRSTYARARLGGMQGRALQVNDVLPCARVDQHALERDTRALPWRDAATATNPTQENEQKYAKNGIQHDAHNDAQGAHGLVTLRAILGPQQDHFTPQAIEDFFGSDYRISSDADRMGLRLDGPGLRHSGKGADIVTDGVTPGAVQVPANGQPIILMQDAQTTGGYAKIAVVILADLPRAGRLQPGDRVRFQRVSLPQAKLALQADQQRLNAWRASVRTVAPAGHIDQDALRTHNLISGVSSDGDASINPRISVTSS